MKKMKKQGGFTLVEMLIVVAIIAILIAIAIPLVNNALEKSRDATDDANYRAAAALGHIILLTEDNDGTAAGTYRYYVSGASSQLVKKDDDGNYTTTDTGYKAYESKCREHKDEENGRGGQTGTFKDAYIQVVIGDSKVTTTWEAKPATP